MKYIFTPGTSGILTPFGKINGLMFDYKDEPDVFIPEFIKEVRAKMEADGKDYIAIDFGDDINAYYDILYRAKEFNRENLLLKVTSRDTPEIIFTHEDLGEDLNGLRKEEKE